MTIVILGPDGAGKSSVIQGLLGKLTQEGRVVKMRHLKPRIVLPHRGEGITINPIPHGKTPRSVLTSIAKIFVWLLEEWYATLFLGKDQTLLICDRYYHDLLIDPVRYRYGGPMWLARLVGNLMPQPGLWVLLDAPAETLQARKQEVSFRETARQRQAYLAFIREQRNYEIIDASQSLDKVIADALLAIDGARSEGKGKRDEVGLFYKAQKLPGATHLALRWNGRARYAVPRDAAARRTCWKAFHPGRLDLPLRAMARLPRLFGAISCVEEEKLASIRESIGSDAGLSCCRSGAPGPWSKDTILFLDKKTSEPLYIVKAGTGEAVDSLLLNEANWLRTLGDQASLADHIPKIVAHRSGTNLSFVVESPLKGKLEFGFGELHIALLRKIQEYSRQTMPLDESRLYRNLRSRMKDLSGRLSETWSTRLEMGMQRIEQALSGSPILFVAAHNDFAPWNIRIERGVARVFDWEYADYEQLPLFDLLHFALIPMALRRQPTVKMVRCMRETLQFCPLWLGKESCCEGHIQTLAYLMNLCTLYLWSVRGTSESHPVLESYARLIDYLCL